MYGKINRFQHLTLLLSTYTSYILQLGNLSLEMKLENTFNSPYYFIIILPAMSLERVRSDRTNLGEL